MRAPQERAKILVIQTIFCHKNHMTSSFSNSRGVPWHPPAVCWLRPCLWAVTRMFPDTCIRYSSSHGGWPWLIFATTASFEFQSSGRYLRHKYTQPQDPSLAMLSQRTCLTALSDSRLTDSAFDCTTQKQISKGWVGVSKNRNILDQIRNVMRN